MKRTTDLWTTNPFTLNAMGFVALGMSTCKAGGKGGRDGRGEVVCIVIKAR